MAGMRGEMGMTRLLSRTSITIDEAIYILLGRSTGPIEMYPLDTDCEEAWAERPSFHLDDHLEVDLDVLEGEYDRAKYEKQPEEVIAKISAAIKREEALIDQADLYRSAIEDELNKGEQSALRVDTKLSNAAYTFITLHSFNEWRKCSADQSNESAPLSSNGPDKKSRKRMRDQRDAILEEIWRQGLDPQALPPYSPGKRGVKSDILESLANLELFAADTAFENAWEYLARYRVIRYATDPTPDKKMKKDTS